MFGRVNQGHYRTVRADGCSLPLWWLLFQCYHSLILNSILIFSSLSILIALCQNCIFPKMFSKVFLFWFNGLSFQCLGWNWGGALWKVNAFEWGSFLWTEILYCSTLKFLRASLCYFISRFPSIFFKTFKMTSNSLPLAMKEREPFHL